MELLTRNERTGYLSSDQGFCARNAFEADFNYQLPPSHVTSVNIFTSQILIAGIKVCDISVPARWLYLVAGFCCCIGEFSMLVNLVLFTMCGILATLTGAEEIADHASIWCER